MESIGRNPNSAGQIFTPMIIGLAFIEALTLYAFSVENWRRPKVKTDFLMQLLREYIRKEMPLIQRNNIRTRFLGRIDELPLGV